MSAINVNSITGRTGSHGPVLTGVTTISGDLHVGSGLSVTGVSTFSNTVVGGATTELVVGGDARITGILTIGTGSVTIDGTSGNSSITGVTTVGITSAYITSINDLNYPTAGPLSNRNLIINGAMRVAQRGASFSMSTTALFCTDRFKAVQGSSFDWQSTLTQESDGPDGFSKSLKVNVDTASTPTGSENAVFYYRLEGQDCQQLGYGSNNAKTTTLSFWVKSNKTGTYSVQFANNNPTRYLLVEYSINSADTWEYKTMSFVGDTASTVDNDNDVGLDVRWNLAAGPTDLAAPSNTWVSTAGIRASNDQVNFMDAVNNYWQITGVQLEVGTKSTPFEHENYGQTLAKCIRYFQMVGDGCMMTRSANGVAYTDAPLEGSIVIPRMRAAPTTVASDGTSTITSRFNDVNYGSAADREVNFIVKSGSSSHTLQPNYKRTSNSNVTLGTAFLLGRTLEDIHISAEL